MIIIAVEALHTHTAETHTHAHIAEPSRTILRAFLGFPECTQAARLEIQNTHHRNTSPYHKMCGAAAGARFLKRGAGCREDRTVAGNARSTSRELAARGGLLSRNSSFHLRPPVAGLMPSGRSIWGAGWQPAEPSCISTALHWEMRDHRATAEHASGSLFLLNSCILFR